MDIIYRSNIIRKLVRAVGIGNLKGQAYYRGRGLKCTENDKSKDEKTSEIMLVTSVTRKAIDHGSARKPEQKHLMLTLNKNIQEVTS